MHQYAGLFRMARGEKQSRPVEYPLLSAYLNGGVIECKPAAGLSGRKPQRFTPYGHYLQGACAGSQGGGQRDLRKLKSSICPHPIRLAQIRHTVVNVLYKCHLWAHSRRGTTKFWGTGLEKFRYSRVQVQGPHGSIKRCCGGSQNRPKHD